MSGPNHIYDASVEVPAAAAALDSVIEEPEDEDGDCDEAETDEANSSRSEQAVISGETTSTQTTTNIEKAVGYTTSTVSVIQAQHYTLKDHHLHPSILIADEEDDIMQTGPPALRPGASRVYPAGRLQSSQEDPITLDDDGGGESDVYRSLVHGVASATSLNPQISQGEGTLASISFVHGMAIIPDADVEYLERPDEIVVHHGSAEVRQVFHTVTVPAISVKAVKGCYISKRQVIWIAVSLLVIVIIVASVVASLVPKARDPENTTDVATPDHVGPESVEDFAATLPDYTQDALRSDIACCDPRKDWYMSKLWTRESPFQPTSPQGQAWKYLMADPLVKSRAQSDIAIRFALSTLYFATDGPNWTNNTNWLSSSDDVCAWFSEDLGNPATDYVEKCTIRGFEELLLSDNGLDGSLPPELALLTDLRVVRMHSNSLRGEITEVVWLSWRNLWTLQLYENQLQGTIHTAVGLMTDLIYLQLGYNQFSGSLPSIIGKLGGSLKVLSVPDNALTGKIPTETGNMRSLSVFEITNNSMEGPIPSQIGALGKVAYLSLGDNRLTSSIPSEIGLCKRLLYMAATSNLLTGSVPTEITRLNLLGKLLLSNNSITGTLPARLGRLSALTELDISDTLISGTPPDSMGQLTQLSSLRLFATEMTGEIPQSVCQAAAAHDTEIWIDCQQMQCSCNCTCQ